MVKADFGIIANNTEAVSERYNNQRLRDSSARPDERVRTGIAQPCLRSLRARHKKNYCNNKAITCAI